MNDDSSHDRRAPLPEDESRRGGSGDVDGPSIGSMAFLARSSSDADAPSQIGSFKILKALGEGGMGHVYLAEQQEPVRRRVALKLIKAGMDTRDVIARFESERQALALMSHTNIASVYEAGTTEQGRPYFVMEYVPGVPITSYCDEHRLPTTERLDLLIQVADAIHHAHQKGIIHRDLKPSNVLVMLEDGRHVPKVIDFGLAKATNQALTDRTLYTQVGQVVGTPEYMSPEQAELDPSGVDTRTDIYSLGVLLYELLTGRLPFDPSSLRLAGLSEMLRVLREDEPLEPSRRLGGIDRVSSSEIAAQRRATPAALVRESRGDLDRVTMKAMAKGPQERYASASEFAADLRRYLRSEPVLATPPSSLDRLRKLARKHRRGLIAATTILGLMALFGVANSYRNHSLAIQRAEERLDAGDAFRRDLAALQKRREALTARINELPEVTWEPVWEADRFALEDELDAANAKLSHLYSEAVGAYREASQIAPPGSTVLLASRKALETIHWGQLEQARQQGSVMNVHAEFFQTMVASQGLGTYERELRGDINVNLEVEPSGTEVFCFRYEKSEQHLVPIPFSPAKGRENVSHGFLSEPVLQVERLWFNDFWPQATVSALTNASKLPPFLPGDRLLTVGGKRVVRRGDLARALAAVVADEVIPLTVERHGKRADLTWVPFPHEVYAALDADETRLRPGRLLDISFQLGITFAGYPLDTKDGCRVGIAQAPSPLTFSLPQGSYLLVARKAGHVETRVPVSSPNREFRSRLVLPRLEDVPPGFVYVPPGYVAFGGDDQAYRSKPRGEQHVDGFFMSELEVTFKEYLAFLNHEANYERIDPESGRAAPRIDWKGGIFHELRLPSEDDVLLVPDKMFSHDEDAGRWSLAAGILPSWPVLEVPMLAAAEYALWFTELHGNRWQFRLPHNLEWERAARGIDRRFCVWGKRVVWTYCASRSGNWRRSARPRPVGLYPLDESIFGVRDLAGSISEPVLQRTPGRRMFVYRGANWSATDPRDVRLATHNRREPEKKFNFIGIRLVADVAASSAESPSKDATGR